MTPRPRRRGSKDLPANLYSNKKDSQLYYRYKHPDTGKFVGFGTDKIKAINAAKQLNQLLTKESSLIDKVRNVNTQHLFSNYLEYFATDVLPQRRNNGFSLAETTMTEYQRIIRCISKELGHRNIKDLGLVDISDYLKQQSTTESFNKHRSQLIFIFKQAISEGLIEQNYPEKTLKKGSERIKRTRLTMEQYTEIYNSASPAIQNAMELSLNTIQRRTDIKNWRFDYDKNNDGHIYLIQSKTRKHGVAAYLRIPLGLPVVHSERGAKTLLDIIRSCRDNLVCPYVIHQKPKRRPTSVAKEKSHLMLLSGDQISDGFADARDRAGFGPDSGLYNSDETPPTFHELISLGEYLRQQQGWSLKKIQLLRGHTSDKLTKHYLDGHDWTTVSFPQIKIP